MWERALSTAATESEDLVGLTYQLGSKTSGCEVAASFDATWSRCRLSMVSGAYEYQSEWLDVSPLLARADMVRLLQEGLKRWHLLATSPYSKQRSSWTPLELTTLLFSLTENVLA